MASTAESLLEEIRSLGADIGRSAGSIRVEGREKLPPELFQEVIRFQDELRCLVEKEFLDRSVLCAAKKAEIRSRGGRAGFRGVLKDMVEELGVSRFLDAERREMRLGISKAPGKTRRETREEYQRQLAERRAGEARVMERVKLERDAMAKVYRDSGLLGGPDGDNG